MHMLDGSPETQLKLYTNDEFRVFFDLFTDCHIRGFVRHQLLTTSRILRQLSTSASIQDELNYSSENLYNQRDIELMKNIMRNLRARNFRKHNPSDNLRRLRRTSYGGYIARHIPEIYRVF